MAAHLGCSADLFLTTEASDSDELRRLGESLGLETLLAAAQILDQALVRMKQSTQTRTLVEMALVRIARLEHLQALPALIAQLQSGGPHIPPILPPRAAASSAPVAPDLQPAGPSVGQSHAPSPPTPASSHSDQKKTDDVVESTVSPPVEAADDIPWTNEEAQAVWSQAVDGIQDMTADYARKAVAIAISGPNRLVASFRKAYSQFKDQLERPERRQRLEQALAEVAGRPIRVEFDLLPDEPETAVPAAKPQPTAARRRQRIKELERNLLVQQAIAVFDAEIIDVIDPPPAVEEAETITAPEISNPDP
jgi:DNA polymerase-3 subunit gamma/tau